MINFTKTTIAALPSKADRYEEQDTKVPGLRVRVSPSGVKTFYLLRRINGPQERIKIGRFPQTHPETARQKAEQLNAEITLGANPAAVKRAAKGGVTLSALFNDYLTYRVTDKGTAMSPETIKAYRWCFAQYLAPFANNPAKALTKDKLKALHSPLKPSRANFLKAMVRGMYSFGISQGKVEENPAIGLQHRRLPARDRFIQPSELQRFLDAVNRNEYRDYWLVLLLTGARSGNVRSMRWDQVDLVNGVWRVPTSKNGEPLRVLLVPEVVTILEARKDLSLDWVFPGKGDGHISTPGRHWRALLQEAGIADLRPHDLRRTLASYQALGGSSLLVIGKSLGHKSVTATAIYARLHDDPVRQSIEGAVAKILNK
jgi:integrase